MARDLYYPETLKDVINDSKEEQTAVSAIKFTLKQRAGQSLNFDGSIILYMPESASNPTNVSWDSASVGRGGNAFIGDAGFVDTLHSGGGALLESANETLAGFQGRLGGGSNAADGQTIEGLKTKTVKNQYLKMAFRGLNFRNFEYLFKFTPHTEDECTRIFEIVQTFRQAALPGSDGGGVGQGSETKNHFKHQYPKEIDIEYLYQGKTHPWLNKFKACVITDLNVNYTGAGFYASMRNGFPSQTELRLQFSEIDLVYRDDVTFRPGDTF